MFILCYCAFQNIMDILLLASVSPKIHSKNLTDLWKVAYAPPSPSSSIEQYCIYNILFPAGTYFLFHGRKEVINNDPTVMWMKENISRTINSSMKKKEKM